MRNLTANFITAATAGIVYPAILVEAEFDEGAVRLWSGYGDLSWDSKTWTGAGTLLSVQPAAETKDLEAQNEVYELSGVPASVISLALGSEIQGRAIRCWLALFDASGNIVSDPYRRFTGKMDTMPIVDDPANPIIRLNAENDLVILTRSRERRWTHEEQQIDYPGDLFFEFVTDLQDKEINWK